MTHLTEARLTRIEAWYSKGFRSSEDVVALIGEVRRLRDRARMLSAARMVLDRIAEGLDGRDEAAAMAQRIVDLTGHQVTDEPPHALVRLAELEAEVETLREIARLARSEARHPSDGGSEAMWAALHDGGVRE
jgi:hypothetical protein